jgi:hypothetical protein
MWIQFRDARTLSDTPRDPTELTRAMVAPVGITALGWMANNGRSLDDVPRLMVADINGLENAPRAEPFLPAAVPFPTPFDEAVRLAGQLRRERAIVLASVDVPKPVSPLVATHAPPRDDSPRQRAGFFVSWGDPIAMGGPAGDQSTSRGFL